MNSKQGKLAALTSYKCLVRYISNMACYNLLSESFSSLIGLLEDREPEVKLATCRLLETIAEFQTESMLSEAIIKRYLDGFIKMIELDEDIFAISMCSIFEKLADKLDNSQLKVSFFFDKIPDLVVVLLNCSFKPPRSNDMSLNGAYAKTLVSIVISCFDMPLIHEFFEKFFDGVTNSAQIQNNDHRIHIEECMCLCMSMINYRAKKNNYAIPKEVLYKCYNCATGIMQKERTILSEAIFLMCSVGHLLGQDFYCFMEEYIAHLEEAVINSKNDGVIAAAFEALGATSRELGGIPDEKVERVFMPRLLSRMTDSSVPVEERVNLFTCLGDLCLGNLKAVLPHVHPILSNFEAIFAAVVEMLVPKSHQERKRQQHT